MTQVEMARDLHGMRGIVFGDVGWTGARRALERHAFGRPLSSVGVGTSFLDGLIRLDLARGHHSATRVASDHVHRGADVATSRSEAPPMLEDGLTGRKPAILLSMKIGLVGFAGSGKTTVFNTMTGLAAPVGYGGELRLGTVRVPDQRIDALSKIFSPKKTTYAEISFADVPGEHGAEKKGLSSKALTQIREQDALCLVLRDFASPAVEGTCDPVRDLEAFHMECLFADLEIIERRLDRAHREKASKQEIDVFERLKHTLDDGRPLRAIPASEVDRNSLRSYSFVTDRPLLVALNRDESSARDAMPAALTERLAALDAAGLVLSASVEAEIASLDPLEQSAFLEDLGLAESALARFIRAAYGLLDLISFFTVGVDEVRAWPIHRGTHARQAAGRIHSDLERGFIRAEVIPYAVFMELGSEHAVKHAGRLQVEGKEYVVSDGDIMHVRFNV